MTATEIPTEGTHDTLSPNLADLEWTVFDTETTGFSPAKGDEVVEICATRIDSAGNRLATVSTLLNPGRDVGPTHIHRITDTMVRHAPRFDQIADALCELMDGSVVVAHNAKFDEQFLVHHLQRSGVEIEAIPMLCTIRMTDQLLLDRVESRSLSALTELFGLDLDGAHAAYVDVRATASLLAGYLQIAQSRGLERLEDLRPSFRKGQVGTARLTGPGLEPAATVNRPAVAALLAQPYPNRPTQEATARYRPPADPEQATAWLEKLARYQARIACPKCGSSLVTRTRNRDGHKFRACSAWGDTGCDYTYDLPDTEQDGQDGHPTDQTTAA